MAVNRNELTSFTTSKVGLNYVWGGTTDAGYDCSGLIYKAYEEQGVSIPRVAQDQYNAANKVSRDKLQPGDSVFFSDTGSTSNVTHTGMYLGNGKYVHASSPSTGIIISDLPTGGSYYVGGGSLAGNNAYYGSPGKYNSANLSAALNSLNGGNSGGSSPSSNLLSALGAAAQATTMGTSVGDMQFYQSTTDTIAAAIAEQVSLKEKILILVGQIVKVLTLIVIFAFAAVLFMKAFDIKRPSLGGML